MWKSENQDEAKCHNDFERNFAFALFLKCIQINVLFTAYTSKYTYMECIHIWNVHNGM